MRLIDADAIELRVRNGIEDDGLLFIPYVDVKKSIANTPTINQWIPVSERLPEEYVDVLISPRFGDVLEGFMNVEGKWRDECGDYIENVIAWMPLPQPYKESEKNDSVQR